MSDDASFKPDPPQKLAFHWVLLLFIYHVTVAVILAYAVYHVWPPMPWPGDRSKVAETRTVAAPATTPSPAPPTISTSEPADPYGGQLPPAFTLFGLVFQPPLETRLILLVLLVGAIGSYVHAASSFVDYLGNRTMVSSWVWWYLLRPFIGMMLALIFYFVFRGGFITGGINTGGESAANFINPFGIAAMAALVGMFSKVATDKLNEVFVTLFRPASGQGDAKRGDKLSDSLNPNIVTLAPNSGPAVGGTSVNIIGSGFMIGATVSFGGLPAPAVIINSAGSLTATTPPHTPGTVAVEVVNTNNQKTTLEEGFTYE